MGTITIHSGNFQQTVETKEIVIVDWWASWCGPCRAFAPVYEKVAENHPDVVFGKINTEEEQELSTAFDIRSIPTLMIFRDKILLFAQPGAISERVLEDLVQQTKALDMNQVREEIAKKERLTRN